MCSAQRVPGFRSHTASGTFSFLLLAKFAGGCGAASMDGQHGLRPMGLAGVSGSVMVLRGGWGVGLSTGLGGWAQAR
jgi:hypothetical protein